VDAFGGRVFPGARFFENENAVGEEGRFTSEDPARDGINWYVYCANNPLAFIDPTGLDPITSPNYKKDPSGGLDRLRALEIVRKDRPRDELTERYLAGISAGLSAVPLVGSVKDIVEGAAGKEFITGKELSTTGRVVSIASGVIGLIPYIGKVTEIILGPEVELLGRQLATAADQGIALKQSLQVPGLNVVEAQAAALKSTVSTIKTVSAVAEVVDTSLDVGIPISSSIFPLDNILTTPKVSDDE
jgi:hypothetical protein